MTARPFAAVTLTTMALILGGCGTQPGPASSSPPVTVKAAVEAGATFNDTDVRYLQMMITHHEQGVELARIAAKSGRSDELRTMAMAISVIQADEITLMRSWLDGWSRPPATTHDASAHAAHGGLPATGPKEIAALRTTGPAAFDATFINLFVAHQHNAVEMSGLERQGGANPETRAFAERVRRSRTDQIRQLLTMLNA